MKATQDWVDDISIMKQSVLFAAIRGPDGIAKGHKCKPLIRIYRRGLLLSAFDNKALLDPHEKGGGDFTGSLPKNISVDTVVNQFINSRDELPFHYLTHFMHAVQIMGIDHSDEWYRETFTKVYERLVNCLHLNVETVEQLNLRLGDTEIGWMQRSEPSGSCST